MSRDLRRARRRQQRDGRGAAQVFAAGRSRAAAVGVKAVAFELQPALHNELIRLEPLRPEDFEALFAVASDPLIWEQHPAKDRYKREVFAGYFNSGIESGGALRVIDNANGELIGSSRYYDLDEVQSKVSVGYTFIARSRWARHFNGALKKLMLDHAFRFVERVTFQVGRDNWRSRKAMEKLGGIYIGEETIAYVPGEPANPNVIFKIDAGDWARSDAAVSR